MLKVFLRRWVGIVAVRRIGLLASMDTLVRSLQSRFPFLQLPSRTLQLRSLSTDIISRYNMFTETVKTLTRPTINVQ